MIDEIDNKELFEPSPTKTEKAEGRQELLTLEELLNDPSTREQVMRFFRDAAFVNALRGRETRVPNRGSWYNEMSAVVHAVELAARAFADPATMENALKAAEEHGYSKGDIRNDDFSIRQHYGQVAFGRAWRDAQLPSLEPQIPEGNLRTTLSADGPTLESLAEPDPNP